MGAMRRSVSVRRLFGEEMRTTDQSSVLFCLLLKFQVRHVPGAALLAHRLDCAQNVQSTLNCIYVPCAKITRCPTQRARVLLPALPANENLESHTPSTPTLFSFPSSQDGPRNGSHDGLRWFRQEGTAQEGDAHQGRLRQDEARSSWSRTSPSFPLHRTTSSPVEADDSMPAPLSVLYRLRRSSTRRLQQLRRARPPPLSPPPTRLNPKPALLGSLSRTSLALGNTRMTTRREWRMGAKTSMIRRRTTGCRARTRSGGRTTRRYVLAHVARVCNSERQELTGALLSCCSRSLLSLSMVLVPG